MFRLVKAELFKLFKNRTFKVLCVISILLSILCMGMVSPLFEKALNGDVESISEENIEVYLNNAESEDVVAIQPGNFGMMLQAKDPLHPTALEVYHSAFGIGIAEVLIGVLIGALFAKEYSESTIKNTLAYGKSRSKFYLSKFLSMAVAISIILFCLTVVATIGSTVMNGWGEVFKISHIGNMILTFAAAVIANSAVASIIMLIVVLLKSNGATIGITVAGFVFLPSMLMAFYGKNDLFDRIFEYSPFYNNQLATSVFASNSDIFKSMFIGIVTIIIFLVFGISIFKKQDIK